MKKVVFIGTYDKTDMLLYIAKLLTMLGKKIVLMDTTVLKKSRYVVPSMIRENQYITTFENVDVAIGFGSIEAIRKYQEDNNLEVIDYDYVFIDMDRPIAYQKLGINSNDKQYFVTSFDIYNLKRGLGILTAVRDNSTINKVYFSKNIKSEEDHYLMHMAKGLNIKWNKNIIYFPFETEDINAIYINQRSGRIQLKGLSRAYLDSIVLLAEDISGEGRNAIKKVLKKLE